MRLAQELAAKTFREERRTRITIGFGDRRAQQNPQTSCQVLFADDAKLGQHVVQPPPAFRSNPGRPLEHLLIGKALRDQERLERRHAIIR